MRLIPTSIYLLLLCSGIQAFASSSKRRFLMHTCNGFYDSDENHPTCTRDNNIRFPASHVPGSKRHTTSKLSREPSFATQRKHFLIGAACTFGVATAALPAHGIPPQPSYSSNARNMERLSSGDASGGSVYNNNPTTAAAQRRRSLTGCKIPSARTVAARNLQLTKGLSEKDCNRRVLQEENNPSFMLDAIRQLECPTCPYGISPTVLE